MHLSPLKDQLKILKQSLDDLKRNDPLRLAAATAFFTTFALPPILIILIQFFGMVTNIENLGDKFFERFANILGNESSAQIKRTFIGFKSLAKNRYITVFGFLFLLFVATTLFKVIKDSLNQLWSIKLATEKEFKVKLEKRVVSMFVILLAGLLFVAATLAEGLEALLGEYFNEFYPGSGSLVNVIINMIISVVVVTIWFSVLFKLLPDAQLSWKVVRHGAFFTAILFTIGKLVMKYMLSFGNLSTVFGASTSIVLLLLFVFYSSFILYFGACYTNVYANYINDPILPGEHSIRYELAEIKTHLNREEIKKEAKEERREITQEN
jgi:membrane protein